MLSDLQNQTHTRAQKINSPATLAWLWLLPQIPLHKHTHTQQFSVIWHNIKASHQWPMKFTNYLKSSLRLSSFSPRVRQLWLRITWPEYLSRVMCLCFHVGKMERNTHAHAHPHIHSTAPQHCWCQTRLYCTPQHIKAQWQLAPAVAHRCKWEWATCRELSLRLAP